MSDTSFLEDIEPDQEVTALGQVMAQVQRLIEVRDKIEKTEETLKELKSVERGLSMETVPTLLQSHGLDKLGLSNDMTLTIVEDIDVSIPKEDEEKRKRALAWLSSHGGGELIKETISFEEPDDSIKKTLTENGFVYVESKEVNGNSLKAWFRAALGMKKGSVARIAVKDIPEEIHPFLYKKTVIK